MKPSRQFVALLVGIAVAAVILKWLGEPMPPQSFLAMAFLAAVYSVLRALEAHENRGFEAYDEEKKLMEAVAAEGYALAPLEPPVAMIEEGARAMASFEDGATWPDDWDPLDVARMRADARKAYRAMVGLAANPSTSAAHDTLAAILAGDPHRVHIGPAAAVMAREDFDEMLSLIENLRAGKERRWAFSSKIARFHIDGENGFEADPTDSMATLENLIVEARAISSDKRSTSE